MHLGLFAADDAGFGPDFAASLYVYTGVAGVVGRLGWGLLLLYYDVSLSFLTQLCAITIGLAVAALALYVRAPPAPARAALGTCSPPLLQGDSRTYLIGFACVFGALGGTAYELGPPMLANMFGVRSHDSSGNTDTHMTPPPPPTHFFPQLEGLAYALGGTYSLRAPTVLLAGPVAGMLRDRSGSYDTAWVASGFLLIAAALPLGLLSCDCRRATAERLAH